MKNKIEEHRQTVEVKALVMLLKQRGYVAHIYPIKKMVSLHGYKKLNYADAILYIKGVLNEK